MDEKEISRRTRRAFLTMAGAGVAGALGARWIWSTEERAGLPGAVRTVLDFNGRVASRVLYQPSRLAPEFRRDQVGRLRANGDVGLGDALADEGWQVTLANSGRKVTIEEIRALPKVEQITEFKCIEGWSTVAHWGGARFRDFVAKFAPGMGGSGYVGLVTPDKEYSVGVDGESMMHPQTLLAYEQNGRPLERAHGAPLRLVIPVKYGIKNIKRIGTIVFSAERPVDYWHEDGYDYYAGL